jgi:hypothetical protein
MKTWEMIKMLEENPKLKFKNIRFMNGDKIENFLSIGCYGYFTAKVFRNGELMDETKPSFGFFGNFKPDDDWQLVRTPVTWQEALQAWVDGKTVKCEYPGKHGGLIISTFCSTCRGPNREALITGTWYIED